MKKLFCLLLLLFGIGLYFMGFTLGQPGIPALLGILFVLASPVILLRILIKEKKTKKNSASEKADDNAKQDDENKSLMLSQHAAFYVYQNSESHKEQYIKKLGKLGFTEHEAEALFDFECEILKKFQKAHLLSLEYTKSWIFGLSQPFFHNYPKNKDDILKERFLTLSELCKIIDEAEWHFWNSHENAMPGSVWPEITEWRLKVKGGEFAIKYFEMVSASTGIPEETLGNYSSNEGRRLNLYKWS